MTIYFLKTPLRSRLIGKHHSSLARAVKAAKRASRRLGEPVDVRHWRDGICVSIYPDGGIAERRLGAKGHN